MSNKQKEAAPTGTPTYAQGQLDQFYRMKEERPMDPTYWDGHEKVRLKEACAAPTGTGEVSEPWRVGTKVPVNVYEGDRPVCQCHTVADAKRIVEAVNSRSQLEEAQRLAGEIEDAKNEQIAHMQKMNGMLSADLASTNKRAIIAERDLVTAQARIAHAEEALRQAAKESFELKMEFMEARQSTKPLPIEEEWVPAKMKQWRDQAEQALAAPPSGEKK